LVYLSTGVSFIHLDRRLSAQYQKEAFLETSNVGIAEFTRISCGGLSSGMRFTHHSFSPMSIISLSRLKKVQLRKAWVSESSDFTPWLAEAKNLALLGETLEMNLELEAQEKNVGPFRADILCRDLGNDSYVLIENQLERTDHSHLGQLLTYAAGLSAVSIIWVAERFTDEHRAALDWLNEKTPEGINFFGLEVELWQIGDSPFAPKFNIVSKPNEWTRSLIETRKNTELGQFCLEYWTGVFERVAKAGILQATAKPMRRKDTKFDVGWKHFWLKAYFSTVVSQNSHTERTLLISGNLEAESP